MDTLKLRAFFTFLDRYIDSNPCDCEGEKGNCATCALQRELDAARNAMAPADFSECPFCKEPSEGIGYGPIEVEDDAAVQECTCGQCERVWQEWYRPHYRNKPCGCELTETCDCGK